MENKNKDPKEVFEGYNEKYDKKLMIDHDYDGIRELDNPPPPWLMWLFYITVFWTVGYLGYFHFFRVGPLQAEEYEIEMKEAAEKYKDNQINIVLLSDENSLKAGEKLYAKSCAACHGADGKGGIGVNLTDNEWIYGSDIKSVFNTVKNGTSKGMTSFNSLPDNEILEVSSFVVKKLNKKE